MSLLAGAEMLFEGLYYHEDILPIMLR